MHGVKDWDDPDTAIEWERMRAALDRLRAGGGMAHASFEYLNSERTGGVDLPAGVEERWSAEFARIRGEGEGGEVEEVEEVKFVLVDGFVLYYDANVRAALDVPLMLRVPAPTLKARREARAVYALQSKFKSSCPPPPSPSISPLTLQTRKTRPPVQYGPTRPDTSTPLCTPHT